jgi:hypothetical protein
MKEQTAMNWLLEKLASNEISKEIIDEALEKEMEQIIDAYQDGSWNTYLSKEVPTRYGQRAPENYYKEKFTIENDRK